MVLSVLNRERFTQPYSWPQERHVVKITEMAEVTIELVGPHTALGLDDRNYLETGRSRSAFWY